MQWYSKATLGFYFSKTSLALMLGGGRKWILDLSTPSGVALIPVIPFPKNPHPHLNLTAPPTPSSSFSNRNPSVLWPQRAGLTVPFKMTTTES